MRNLIRFPYWHPDHLGEPLPESEHATSVAMPQWSDVVDYEEGELRVTACLRAGYPRFRIHEHVEALNARVPVVAGEKALVFPSAGAAQRCLDFVHRQKGAVGRIGAPINGVYPVVVPESAFDVVYGFWQHCGEIVSSRHALKALEGCPKTQRGALAKTVVKQRIATLAGDEEAPVWLHPTGMASIYAAFRAATQLRPDLPTVQFGFPYVDTLKLQEKLGSGVEFLPDGDEADIERIIQLAAEGSISAVFCECPTNPLLKTPDLIRLSEALRPAGIPLIVDNTLDSFDNLDVLPWADLVATSLTKYFSGVGDVMGGSLVLNRQSPLYENLKTILEAQAEDLLWDDDALALELNSRDFKARMETINTNTRALVQALREDSRIAGLFYPEHQTTYQSLRKWDSRGFGGLFSLVLHEAEHTSPVFYNRLRLCKGPSLGTGFSLVCAYTQLAHFEELDWASQRGVSPWLLRISVGEESDLIQRFQAALDGVSQPVRRVS